MSFDQATREYFDRFTPNFEPSRFEFALGFLNELPAANSVLDIGCGDGATLALIAARTRLRNLTGLDIAPAYLARARELTGCSTVEGSILERQLIKRYEGRFDVVILGAVLHHLVAGNRRNSIRNAAEAIENTLRLLKVGGHLIIFEPTHAPRIAMWLVFWIKRAVTTFASGRLALGASWLNFGQPAVSYLTARQLDELVQRASVAHSVTQSSDVDHSRMAGLIERRGRGLIIRRL